MSLQECFVGGTAFERDRNNVNATERAFIAIENITKITRANFRDFYVGVDDHGHFFCKYGGGGEHQDD
jgi:hypothetical protein